MELDNEHGTSVPSYAIELGTRLEAAAEKLGRDSSVQVTERSWKQLSRYFKGAEPPLGVVSNLARASGASLAYLIDGIVQVSEDAELERLRIDERLKNTREEMSATTDPKKISALKKHEALLLERSKLFLKITVALLSKRKYPSSYDEYFDQRLAKPRNEIDPHIIEELQQKYGIITQPTGKQTQETAADSARPEALGQIDQALMGRCSDAFGKLYKEMGVALSMADLGRLSADAYNDVVAGGAEDLQTQLVVIRSLVERHRRGIVKEAAANAHGKRSVS